MADDHYLVVEGICDLDVIAFGLLMTEDRDER